MDHYENVFICKKDVSCAGDSPGINFKANSQLLFLLFDNWCYKMIIVPGPRTKAFDVRNLVLPYMKLQFFVELFSCPTMYKIPETCPPRDTRQNQAKTRTQEVRPGGHAPNVLFPIAPVGFPAGAPKDPVCASTTFDVKSLDSFFF